MSIKTSISGKVQNVKETVGQQVDLVGAMLTVGIAGVVGYVLLFAMESTEGSVDTTGSFGDAADNLTQGITDAFGLAPVVFIIIFLTVAIGYLTLLRRRS